MPADFRGFFGFLIDFVARALDDLKFASIAYVLKEKRFMRMSHDFIAVPPGATIEEQIYDWGMSLDEFATFMKISQKEAEGLIVGATPLTAELALKLQAVFGVPASFWNNMEKIYRSKINGENLS